MTWRRTIRPPKIRNDLFHPFSLNELLGGCQVRGSSTTSPAVPPDPAGADRTPSSPSPGTSGTSAHGPVADSPPAKVESLAQPRWNRLLLKVQQGSHHWVGSIQQAFDHLISSSSTKINQHQSHPIFVWHCYKAQAILSVAIWFVFVFSPAARQYNTGSPWRHRPSRRTGSSTPGPRPAAAVRVHQAKEEPKDQSTP